MAEIGGKGLFTKEIEEALFAGHIDLAVHSLKDVETWLPDGLEIGLRVAARRPARCIVSLGRHRASRLCRSGRLTGTASLRRQAQLLRRRADLTVVPIRGNVNTRLRKLEAGEVDALVLALCGLERLGEAEHGDRDPVAPRSCCPQWAKGHSRSSVVPATTGLRRLLETLHDPGSAACVAAERAMLAALDGSCRTPIAGLAELDGDRLVLEGLLLKPDGSAAIRARRTGSIGEAEALGTELGGELRHRAGPGFGLD